MRPLPGFRIVELHRVMLAASNEMGLHLCHLVPFHPLQDFVFPEQQCLTDFVMGNRRDMRQIVYPRASYRGASPAASVIPNSIQFTQRVFPVAVTSASISWPAETETCAKFDRKGMRTKTSHSTNWTSRFRLSTSAVNGITSRSSITWRSASGSRRKPEKRRESFSIHAAAKVVMNTGTCTHADAFRLSR